MMGVLAMVSRKKGNWIHRKAGSCYYWSMAFMFASAMLLLLFLKFSLLMFALACMASYLSISGKRAIKLGYKTGYTWMDLWLAIGGVSIGLGILVYSGLVVGLSNFASTSVCLACVLLGILQAIIAFQDLMKLGKPLDKTYIILKHMKSSVGSMAAITSAFLAQNLQKEIQPWVALLVPSLLALALVNYWCKRVKSSGIKKGFLITETPPIPY